MNRGIILLPSLLAATAAFVLPTPRACLLLRLHGIPPTPESLIEAIRETRPDDIDRLLAAGTDPNQSDRRGLFPVTVAIRRGDKPALERLLESGGRLPAGSVALAVQIGNRELAKALLARGALVDEADSEGRTALALAVQMGRDDLADDLLAAGANPRRKLPSGDSLVYAAVRAERPALARKLAALGPDSETPEQLAKRWRQTRVSTLKHVLGVRAQARIQVERAQAWSSPELRSLAPLLDTLHIAGLVRGTVGGRLTQLASLAGSKR